MCASSYHHTLVVARQNSYYRGFRGGYLEGVYREVSTLVVPEFRDVSRNHKYVVGYANHHADCLHFGGRNCRQMERNQGFSCLGRRKTP